jgi:hyperosmotically inducible protein
MIKLRRIGCMAGGAAAMYFLDPQLGRRRRAVTRDRLRSNMRRRRRRMEQRAVYEEQREHGEVLERAGKGRFHQWDDRSVADHLHQVLATAEVPAKDVTVEVLDDRVRLRGEVRTVGDMSKVLELVAAESGNRRLESFLHLPDEPAPNKQPARRASG